MKAATYHCMSRVTKGCCKFDEREKRYLRQLIWDAADYCGLMVLTYAVMWTHPHVLVLVPLYLGPPGDEELLRRYRVLHPNPTERQSARIEVLRENLAANNPAGVKWRQQQLAQMGDISAFMKIVKQRFTQWFNRRRKRYGTIWAERFKSVLVEENSAALLPMSAYIDLNPVRAGLVTDPKDYLYSGYAEAVAGNLAARLGILRVTERTSWPEAQAAYRLLLHAVGVVARHGKKRIPIERFERVAAEGGLLSMAEVLRCRIRQFTDGRVIGSKEFVAAHLDALGKARVRRRRGEPQELPPVTDWGGLTVLTRVRRG